jgi:endonuclease/exonuclease/phosphatase family metal-dependent hydrolase
MIRLLLLALTLAVAAGCDGPAADDDDSAAPTEGSFSVLTYNVHGLPPEITGDDTTARMELIGPLLHSFDVIGLQEDFVEGNHALLAEAAPHPTELWFDAIYDEHVYGSGLAVFANHAVADYTETHFVDCYGTFDNSSDCLASKGFQVARLQLAEGVTVDLYNSHFEAGGGEDNDEAREGNVAQVIEAMQTFSANRAVLFVGDTNLHDDDPADLPLLTEWVDGTGLLDACDAVGCAEPGRIEEIMFRSGGGVELSVESWTNEPAFFDGDGVPMSDHPAISATIAWSVQ